MVVTRRLFQRDLALIAIPLLMLLLVTNLPAQRGGMRRVASGAVVSAQPLGNIPAPAGTTWKVEYADAFGECSVNTLTGCASGMSRGDNTYWPNRKLGDTACDPGFNSNEMECFLPSKDAVTTNGLQETCTFVSSGHYQCGDYNGGVLNTAVPSGYKLFGISPGHGQDFVLQAVVQYPPNTGEEDPGFWLTDPHWSYELDMFEGWGRQSTNGWCGATQAWPAMPKGGGSGNSENVCKSYGGVDPSKAFHVVTTVLHANHTWSQYGDGVLEASGAAGTSPDMSGVIFSYSLRTPLSSTGFTSGSRSMYIRSIAVYEAANQNNAGTTNGGLVAPGTTISGTVPTPTPVITATPSPAATPTATATTAPTPTPTPRPTATATPMPTASPAPTGTPTPGPTSANLIPNGSFEQAGFTGWATYNSDLTQVTDGRAPNGTHVARDTLDKSVNWFSMDRVHAVADATAGKVYSASAYVAAATSSSVEKNITLAIRERTPGGAVVAHSIIRRQLGSAFQKLAVSYTVHHSGDTVEVYLMEGGSTMAAGSAFYADDVSLETALT